MEAAILLANLVQRGHSAICFCKVRIGAPRPPSCPCRHATPGSRQVRKVAELVNVMCHSVLKTLPSTSALTSLVKS